MEGWMQSSNLALNLFRVEMVDSLRLLLPRSRAAIVHSSHWNGIVCLLFADPVLVSKACAATHSLHQLLYGSCRTAGLWTSAAVGSSGTLRTLLCSA
eukprot:6211759-Amphidinium_carterae.2